MLMIGGQRLELTHTWTCQNMRGWLTGGAIGGKEGYTEIGLNLKSTEGPMCMYVSQVLDMDPSEGRRAQVTLRDKVIPLNPTRRGEDGTTEDRGCPRKVPYKEPK